MSRIVRSIRDRGLFGAARAAWYVLVTGPRKAKREARDRPRLKPTLHELVRALEGLEVDAAMTLRRLGLDVPADADGAFEAHREELVRRTGSRRLTFPATHAVEQETGRFLYLLVRALRPRLVVETGVANGASTFLILRALEDAGEGQLVSLDVSDEVGVLLDPSDRESRTWDLRIISPGEIEAAIQDLTDIDVFIHDSDHSYVNVRHELEAAAPRLRREALLLSDDAELSYAFLDTTKGWSGRRFGLFDRRKLFAGIVRQYETSDEHDGVIAPTSA